MHFVYIRPVSWLGRCEYTWCQVKPHRQSWLCSLGTAQVTSREQARQKERLVDQDREDQNSGIRVRSYPSCLYSSVSATKFSHTQCHLGDKFDSNPPSSCRRSLSSLSPSSLAILLVICLLFSYFDPVSRFLRTTLLSSPALPVGAGIELMALLKLKKLHTNYQNWRFLNSNRWTSCKAVLGRAFGESWKECSQAREAKARSQLLFRHRWPSSFRCRC